MSFVISNSASADVREESGRSWMVVRIHEQDMALRSELIAAVYRTADAQCTQLSAPAAQIEVHGGRPWFIVSPRHIFLALDASVPTGDHEWTVAFEQPQGVAIHAQAIEGPYRGVVMRDTLKTPQGAWPILRPLI